MQLFNCSVCSVLERIKALKIKNEICVIEIFGLNSLFSIFSNFKFQFLDPRSQKLAYIQGVLKKRDQLNLVLLGQYFRITIFAQNSNSNVEAINKLLKRSVSRSFLVNM